MPLNISRPRDGGICVFFPPDKRCLAGGRPMTKQLTANDNTWYHVLTFYDVSRSEPLSVGQEMVYDMQSTS